MNPFDRVPAGAVYPLQVAALAIAYLAAAQLGLSLARLDGNLTLVWPPTGIALAVLLRYGPHLWPGVTLGAVAVTWLTGAPAWFIVTLAFGNSLEAWVAARWLRRRGMDPALTQVADVVALLVIGVLLCPLLSAGSGVAGLYLSGMAHATYVGGALLSWWVGNAMGALIVAPLLLVWSTPGGPGRRWSRRKWLEAIAVLLTGIVSSVLVFGAWPGVPTAHAALLYLPVLVMLWASVRFDLAGASALVLVVNALAVIGTVQGTNPFATDSPAEGLLALWTFMGAASATVLVTAALVAERRRAGEALHRSRERLTGARDFTNQVLESLPGIFYLFGEDGRMLRWNRQFEEVGGYRPEEILHHHALEFVRDEDRERVASVIRDVFEHGEARTEAAFRYRDGRLRPYLFTGTRIDTRDGRYLIGVGLDVSERQEAEAGLRHQTETLQRIIDNIPIMLCFIDARYELRLVNREWVRVLGWDLDEARDGGIFRRLYPDSEQRRSVIRHLAAADSEWREYRTTVRDGRVIDTVWTAVRLSDGTVVGLGQDLTELKRTREELYQVQRMESIGRLSAGIAHDFNNLLVPILGYLETALERLRDHEVRADLEVAQTAASRAADLTRQILAFSRQQLLELKVVDLNATVAEFRRMLDRLLGENVRLTVKLASRLDPVRADQGQIEQALMNLAVNARDAMPDGGELTIETRNVDLTTDPLRHELDTLPAPGPHVALVVRDTGVGMDSGTLKHIFEPFFTSKERGRGTGLGLSTVFGIVKQHQGHVTVDSAPGRGATFTILLPSSHDPVPEPLRPPAAAAEAVPARGRETVLVVEDEALVRELVCEALTANGYRVLEAHTPAQAVEQARRHGGIDLLLSDVVMPGMGGPEVHQHVAALQPTIRVMFMSGYADAWADELELAGGAGFLHKPFSIATLLGKVRTVLDRPRPG